MSILANETDYFAHSRPGRPVTEWEPLPRHLEDVSELTGKFAAVFGAGEWGNIAGLWHDLGKYSSAFQSYLSRNCHHEDLEATGRIDHSTAGAQHAFRALKESDAAAARLLAYCIAGHHSGLLDSGSAAAADVPGTLAHRLGKTSEPWTGAPADWLAPPHIAPPPFDWTTDDGGFQLAMFGRMLFSCLVDADFLCTERFIDATRTALRQSPQPCWEEWARRVDQLVATKQASSRQVAPRSVGPNVNVHRAAVFERCIAAAAAKPGFFSLTVPTGGGKTLASFGFALRHAAAHRLNRVIYALPFTSIIEQNALVLRDALGDGGAQVLEHHSNLDPAKETYWGRLASENWDASVVVTTNVQLFESLFANRTSRCRKLHRLARSVIILDEAQSLPVDLLRPCLAALAELVRNYGTTVVLCTATQPAIMKRKDFPIGLAGVREIIGQPAALFDALRRVRVTQIDGELPQADLADRIAREPRVLCIVETKRRAAELFELVRARGIAAIHLSAAMCPAHRSPLIARIKAMLNAGEPCRVISTQLVEAGVDVDFPVVYRSIAGLDAIAQAAGRCNREGRLTEPGQVFVFTPEGGVGKLPPGHLRQSALSALEILPDHQDDPLSLEAINRYFELHYWKKKSDWDKRGVMKCLSDAKDLMFDYAKAAKLFQMIPYEQRPVVVPWGDEGNRIIAQLVGAPYANLDLKRRAQRYSIQVPANQFDILFQKGHLQDFEDRPAVLHSSWMYDDVLGFCPDKAESLPPDISVC